MPLAAPIADTASQAGLRSLPRAPVLAVVVVNFCQWRNTTRLVQQLTRSDAFRGQDADLTVVDNASPTDSVATSALAIDGVRVLHAERNLGFAAAVNRGSDGDSDWILLLHPDMTVPDGFLDDVLKVIDRTAQRTGIVGLALANPDGTPQPSTGRYPSLINTLWRLIKPRTHRKCDEPAGPAEVGWATGGCLLVRRECWRQLAGLAESFFLYYEDVDFCRRATLAGWQVSYDPGAAATHHSPLHRRQVPAPLRVVTRHALLTYAERHWPAWQVKILALIVWLEGAWRGLASNACHRPLRLLALDALRGRTRRTAARVRSAARQLAPVAAAQDCPQ
jgi:N-acetylglucosaminyl-diphospho-decaprenol L-rhamnosyltransferase